MPSDLVTSPSALAALSDTLADAVERAGRFVVAVHGRGRLPSSGVRWRPGVIVTANHTLERDDEIGIATGRAEPVDAQLVGRDPGTDLAVLKTSDAAGDSAEFADIATLRVGHIVLALGAGGDGIYANLGILSALGPGWTTWRGGQVERFIRADLDLPGGFSGGPLIDSAGKIVGINTSALSRRFDLTLGNATVNRVLDQLLSKGHVTRGYLGLGMQPVRLPESLVRGLQLKTDTGIIVVSVEPDQAADRAGMMIGDVLVALGDAPVEDPEDVLAQLGPDRVGKPLRAHVIRANRPTNVDIIVGERPATWED